MKHCPIHKSIALVEIEKGKYKCPVKDCSYGIIYYGSSSRASKMTRGIWKFKVDQGIFDDIYISNLPSTRIVAIRQNNEKILVKYDSLNELIDALKSAKKWLTLK